jgi:hypothetical protein
MVRVSECRKDSPLENVSKIYLDMRHKSVLYFTLITYVYI